MKESTLRRLLEIGETLIPSTSSMVGAGLIDDADRFIARAIESRPDLGVGLDEAVASCTDEVVASALTGGAPDSPSFDQVATLIVGAYYMNPIARRQIGYPGQLALEYDPMEYVSWVDEGLLDQVLSNGPRFRKVLS